MSKAETKFAIIGIGNCGNQVAYLAEKKYGTLFESIYINTSSSDLSQIQPSNENLVFKIGDEDEVEGSGKNRSKMKEYLRSDIKNILEGGPLWRQAEKTISHTTAETPPSG